ncbi:hypothetical protein GcM1_247214 [Golovinomyces cichoracearum]|uniref:Uncharacterized protein n=1 Tax=Golovinomyces cichoracearum TaxID=62708 RepID=A0A420IDZ5_9PEZI|nr:hypothetical protein GcM1_247214 [Golovinomyces cichoracearum]
MPFAVAFDTVPWHIVRYILKLGATTNFEKTTRESSLAVLENKEVSENSCLKSIKHLYRSVQDLGRR